MPSDGAEQGGEGGSERKDFRDTVMFKTIVTDKQERPVYLLKSQTTLLLGGLHVKL